VRSGTHVYVGGSPGNSLSVSGPRVARVDFCRVAREADMSKSTRKQSSEDYGRSAKRKLKLVRRSGKTLNERHVTTRHVVRHHGINE
jgi:hypothetical protein